MPDCVVGAAAGVGTAWGLTSSVPEFFVGRSLSIIDVDLRASWQRLFSVRHPCFSRG
jgi:hypothetical protein